MNQHFCRVRRKAMLAMLSTIPVYASSAIVRAQAGPLKFGVGPFQPDRERNDATYRPLAEHLSRRLQRPVELRTVDNWQGLANSLASGETDMALMGPWGYVLANHFSGAQAVSTILYDGKPEYFALIVTHPDSGLNSVQDLLDMGKDRTFAFGDKGSTSGYLIPLHFFIQHGVDPARHFAHVLYTNHQAIETQVALGHIDAGADYNRNRNAMIEQGLIRPERSKVIWHSMPLPNDAFAVSEALSRDGLFIEQLRQALAEVESLLKSQPGLLPAHYTGFLAKDNSFYKPIRDAGLSTGALKPK